jgi:hypothetical protein
VNDDVHPEDSSTPEALHGELGRRRLRLWWLVLALLVGALALMYLAQQLREREQVGKQACHRSELSSHFYFASSLLIH